MRHFFEESNKQQSLGQVRLGQNLVFLNAFKKPKPCCLFDSPQNKKKYIYIYHGVSLAARQYLMNTINLSLAFNEPFLRIQLTYRQRCPHCKQSYFVTPSTRLRQFVCNVYIYIYTRIQIFSMLISMIYLPGEQP